MKRTRNSSTVTALAIILTAALLCGCGGIGAHSVARDRYDYTDAISSSWKQQMLLNMVKLRYGDTPVFLDVVSVINQYALETQVDVRWNWVDPVVTVGDSHTAGGAARYSDKPTITYAPLTGERFARSIMKPIPPPAVLSLIQAGYPVDVVLRVCTNSVNGVRNRYGGSARARPADPDFKPLLEALRRIQDAGGMGLRVRKTNETDATMLVLRDKGERTASVAQDVAFVRKTLGLDPAADTFSVAYGSVARDDKELAILTRSMLEILVDLASYIEVPPDDIRETRVGPTVPPDDTPLIRIQSSASPPPDTFVSVRYKNHWYWVDDRDPRSKTLFSFLMFLFSLTETESHESAPIVTIPAG
jgi:hypothetical protein